MKGKIVLIPFPFTNLTAAKLRPALVLFDGEGDVVVAFISSRVPHKPALTDVVVEESHPEFVLTGLKMSSDVNYLPRFLSHVVSLRGSLMETEEEIKVLA